MTPPVDEDPRPRGREPQPRSPLQSASPSSDPDAIPSAAPAASPGPDPAAAPPGPDAPAEAKAEETSAEEEGLEGKPDTPQHSLDTLSEAMQWAFRGEEIEPRVLELFARHAALMLEHNRVVNLTAVVDPREIAAKHYLDSWRVTRQVSMYGRTVLDLGSGAGFPGLPVAMTESDTRVVLLDSTKKRVDFLTNVIATLGLKNVAAVWARAEDHLARNNYDVVVMRAVSSVRENVRLLRKVRHSHKDLVMLKGPSWSREVRAGEREAERLGFRLDTVWEHSLPEGMGERAILVYRAPGAQGR